VHVTLLTLLIVKVESYYGCMKCVILESLLRLPALSSAHWRMQSGPFIVPLILFLGVGRVASNEVIIQLLKSKCLPILY